MCCYARCNSFSPGYNRKLEGEGEPSGWCVDVKGNMTDHLAAIQVVIKYSGKTAGGEGVIYRKMDRMAAWLGGC